MVSQKFRAFFNEITVFRQRNILLLNVSLNSGTLPNNIIRLAMI